MNKKHENMLIYTAYALVGAFLMAICIYMQGCKSPYPPCDASGVYRCSGSVVEICDGKNWNPRRDCAEVWMGGEKAEPLRCVAMDGEAMCEEVE
jgi:hypothetical protein